MSKKRLSGNYIIMILKLYYKIKHPETKDEDIPYYHQRSVLEEIWHLIRKGICQKVDRSEPCLRPV